MCTYTRREIITVYGTDTYTPTFSLQNVLGFKVINVSTANDFYNIIEGVNDKFDWTGSDTNPYSITIPAGQYDPYSLATVFTTTANTAQAVDVFTVSYDINTKKFTITTDNSIIPLWVSGPNTATNISLMMGYYNDTVANETLSIQHISDHPAQLVPSHYLLKSRALGAGRKSNGGGGGTQISSKYITSNPQDYLIMVPNQIDGSASTFAYSSRDDDNERFMYNAPRQIDDIDLQIVHPFYPTLTDAFISIYTPITYEIEFLCSTRYK